MPVSRDVALLPDHPLTNPVKFPLYETSEVYDAKKGVLLTFSQPVRNVAPAPAAEPIVGGQ